jgi:hypothetical protein
MSSFNINNEMIMADDPRLPKVLAHAHKSKIRPLCLCKPGGVEMYIAHISDQFVIKRMPNSGPSHHHDCDSFEMPPELSGRGQFEGKAITEDGDSGFTSLKLDFSLSKQEAAKGTAKAEPSEKSTVQSDPKKLSIRSLLHLLYEDAGLNRWSPKMAGKRNWRVIRKYLLEAAHQKQVKRNPLFDTLLIPKQFTQEEKDANAAQRKKFIMGLQKQQGNKTPLGIVIGELKDFSTARYGKRMTLKHMPEVAFFLDEATVKRIDKVFEGEFDRAAMVETSHLLTIATFQISPSGFPLVVNISFMNVNENWIPFDSKDDLDLVNQLISENRNFIKGLRYNLGKNAVMANVLVTDTEEKPTAIYIVPLDPGEEYYKELAEVQAKSRFSSVNWDINSESSIFELPPRAIYQ